jgi:4-hydroxythreonine-4-phosphate dehydrogenase
MMLAHGPCRSRRDGALLIADIPKRLTPTRLRRVFEVTLEALECPASTSRLGVARLNRIPASGILGKKTTKSLRRSSSCRQGLASPDRFPVTRCSQAARGAIDAVVAMFTTRLHSPQPQASMSIRQPGNGRPSAA